MTIEDHRRDRTALRQRLYENGFSPLPNHNKACFLPEWTSVKVTPALIQSREWARSRSWQDTGLRCGEIVAIDWDVNDPALLNLLLDEVVAAKIIPESPFVRIGKPPRELWVYRTSDKIGKRTTGAFMRGESEEEKVEILGAGCQFAGYGMRDETTPYRWPERDLLDAQYMDLPEITLAQVEALKDFAVAFFERQGLERKSPMAGTDGGYTHAYDLTPDMVFDVHDMGEMSVAEIETYLHQAPDEVLRCKVDALRPTGGSWAGMISLVHGDVCLSDHGTYTSHFPKALSAEDATARLGAKLSALIERAARVAPPPATGGDGKENLTLAVSDDFDTNLAKSVRRYIYVKEGGQIIDLVEGFRAQPLRIFREQMAPFFTTKVGSRGGEVKTHLADAWVEAPTRIEASKAQMRPDMPRPFYHDEEGLLCLNLYQPVEHDTRVVGSSDIGLTMIHRLLPIDSERRYFMQWLAHKLANPHIPGPAIVMVAHDSFGTGRGSLFALLEKVFGERYTAHVDFNTLAGRTSQSQYNEWRVQNLLITVDEAQDTSGASRWQARNNAYEHLKEIVDPSRRRVNVVRKTVSNSQGISYASLIVATNHSDALVIPEGDRRFFVVENGAPQPPSEWARFHAWMADRINVAAFVAELRTVDLTGFNPFEAPPMTRAKLDMIDAGASVVDKAIREIMAGLPGRLLTREQLNIHIEDWLAGTAVEFPEDWPKTADIVYRRMTRKIFGVDRLLLDNRQRVVRMLPGCPTEVLESTETMRHELDRNGPVTRPLKSSGKVVSFPSR